MAETKRERTAVKKQEGQLELDLPELERPRWQVRGFFEEGERVSAIYDDKGDAEFFKGELEKVCPNTRFKLEMV